MGPQYRRLLDEYVEELRAVKAPVNEWWSRLVTAELAKTRDDVLAAEKGLRRRWPNGPATHPRVVAIVRKYYLACDRLNYESQRNLVDNPERAAPHVHDGEGDRPAEEEKDLPMNPAVFVGEMLFSKETDDLAKIIGKFSYWPIGMDQKGAYV